MSKWIAAYILVAIVVFCGLRVWERKHGYKGGTILEADILVAAFWLGIAALLLMRRIWK